MAHQRALDLEPRFVDFETKAPEAKLALLQDIGGKVYDHACAACHQLDGRGLPGVFPPLAGDPLANDPAQADRHVQRVLNGAAGESIGGVDYAAAMPAYAGQLSDIEIAAVVTWVNTSWGNQGGMVEPANVKALR
jgi:mono/diheme cytochrome c family protein